MKKEYNFSNELIREILSKIMLLEVIIELRDMISSNVTTHY